MATRLKRFSPAWWLVVLVAVGLPSTRKAPRARVEPELIARTAMMTRASAFPDSLAQWPAWLEANERRAGVTDTGVMKRVVFADSAPRRTVWSVVYLHGFSATRQETAPVAEQIADSLHANLFETRLHGHGLPADSLASATARQWIRDAEGALAAGAALGDSVLLIGTSTGGTLAAWLATEPDSLRRMLRRIVLISPNFAVRDLRSKVLTWPWAPVLIPKLIPTHTWPARNDDQARYWTTTYSTRALFPMAALVKAVQQRPLEGWNTPSLIFASDEDAVVDADATRAWIRKVRSTTAAHIEDEWITPASGEDNHVLAGRILAPSQVAPFVQRILTFMRAKSRPTIAPSAAATLPAPPTRPAGHPA